MKRISLSLALSLSIFGSLAFAQQEFLLRTCVNDDTRVSHISVGHPESISHTNKIVVETNGLLGKKTNAYLNCAVGKSANVEEFNCPSEGRGPAIVFRIDKTTIRAVIETARGKELLACDAQN